jgi:hypothetical protein
MRIVSLAIVLALVSSTVASAQPSLTPPTLPTEQAPPSTQPQPLTLPRFARAPKNRDTAFLLSSVGTLVPIGIFFAGIRAERGSWLLLSTGAAIFAPSAGHWYADRFFTGGMGLRALGATVSGVALLSLFANDDGPGAGAEKLFFAGLGVVVVGAVWDIATAGKAVDDWNRANVPALTPTVMKTGDGYGFGLAGSF